jgi:hypothetical protein
MTLGGTENNLVKINSQIRSTYQAINNPVTLLYRDNGPNNNVTGTYGLQPDIRVNVPPFQTPGNYEGVITVTMTEN